MPASMKLCFLLVCLSASPLFAKPEIAQPDSNKSSFKRVLRFFGIGTTANENQFNSNFQQFGPCGVPFTTTTTPAPLGPLCPYPMPGQGPLIGPPPPNQPNFPRPNQPNFPDTNQPNFPNPNQPNFPNPNQPNLPNPNQPNFPNSNQPYPQHPNHPNFPNPNQPNLSKPVPPNVIIPNQPNPGVPVSSDLQGDRPFIGKPEIPIQIPSNSLKPGEPIFVNGPLPLHPNNPYVVDPVRPFNPTNPILVQPLKPNQPTVFQPVIAVDPVRPVSPINQYPPPRPTTQIDPILPQNPNQPNFPNPNQPYPPQPIPPFVTLPLQPSNNISQGPYPPPFQPPPFQPPPTFPLRPGPQAPVAPWDTPDVDQQNPALRPLPCSAYRPFVPNSFYLTSNSQPSACMVPNQNIKNGGPACSTLDTLARLGATKMRSLIINSGFDSKIPGYTLFAPLDVAFKRIPAWFINLLETDEKFREAFVLNHFVRRDLPLKKMGNEYLIQNARPGASRMRINLYYPDTEFPVYLADGARIVSGDILTANGRIHLVDKTIMPNPPRSAAEYLSERMEFESFWNVVKRSNSSLERFQSENPITLFIPINEAIDAMDIKPLLKDEVDNKRKNFINYHAVNGTYYSSGMINSEFITTLYNKEIKMGIVSDGYTKYLSTINGHIRVLKSDIPLINGVAHIISRCISDSTSFYIYEDSDEFPYENGVISKRNMFVGKEKTLQF